MRLKIALLAVVIFISAASGAWLLLSPSIEHQRDLDRQNELLSELAMVTTQPATPVPSGPATSPELEATEPEPTAEVPVEPVPTEQAKPEPTPFIPPDDPFEAIGTLAIEKINLKLPVVCGVAPEQLKIALGYVPQTPPIGETGNAVIAGHRNYTYGSMFNRLGEVEIGDIIAYTPKGGETMTFTVFEVTVITPGDPITFIQPNDESIITLYTCTPVRKATHRLLVRARLAD